LAIDICNCEQNAVQWVSKTIVAPNGITKMVGTAVMLERRGGEALETPADQEGDLDRRKENCNTLSKRVHTTKMVGC
jgi:hypothetical protein